MTMKATDRAGRAVFAGIGVIVLLALAACEPPKMVNAPPLSPVRDDSAAAQFAAVHEPSGSQSRVIGFYTKGCIAGARPLARDAPTFQVLNPSRDRAWGHPDLIRLIGTLSQAVARDGHRGLLVGDLAQARGGPLPSDHNSHQVGLDADIWLTPLPERRLSAAELETFEPPSMVDPDTLKVNANFGPAQVSMLRHAAQAPGVERIFVAPPIKQALCKATEGQPRDWLQRIRPWRGHMAHMHVRLGCPAGSDGCKAQEAPPEGDGCGEELQSWFKDTAWSRVPDDSNLYVPEKAMRLEALPAECQALLKQG